MLPHSLSATTAPNLCDDFSVENVILRELGILYFYSDTHPIEQGLCSNALCMSTSNIASNGKGSQVAILLL